MDGWREGEREGGRHEGMGQMVKSVSYVSSVSCTVYTFPVIRWAELDPSHSPPLPRVPRLANQTIPNFWPQKLVSGMDM